MGLYTILKNSTLDIDLQSDYQDGGWSFLNGTAIHNSLNEGSIYNKVFRPIRDKEYTLMLEVSGINTGYLDVTMGGVNFGRITAPGTYSLKSVCLNSDYLKFNAGFNDVTIVKYYINEGENDGTTLVFDNVNNIYIGEMSLKGEMSDRFLEDFIVYKNGVPWISDKNDSRNVFFGEKHPSVIKFYCNIDYNSDKDFYTIGFNGNSAWNVDLSLPPRKGKSLGQKSRIKLGNFKFDKGRYVGSILRDMNDPRFNDELQALMKGAYLQGQIMEVTITNNSYEKVELMSVDIEVAVK